jgi:hypothetical protein
MQKTSSTDDWRLRGVKVGSVWCLNCIIFVAGCWYMHSSTVEQECLAQLMCQSIYFI